MAASVKRASQVEQNKNGIRLGITLLVAILCLGSWWFWPTKVQLNEDGYQVAIALYRVCNLQDERGLQAIEAKMEGHGDSASKQALQDIVDQANAGQWRDAAMACRKILDDQVSH